MTTTITDNTENERYELRIDDELVGILEYRGRGQHRALTHTEIFAGHEGQGLGSRLVKGALDDLRERQIEVTPVCPFVTSFLREHRDYVDLVSEESRPAFGL